MKISKKIALQLGALGLAIGAVATPAVAHHSFAMFDQNQIASKRSATISEFRFTNPHSFVVVNVKEGGKTVRYVFECSSVNMMSKAGWRHNTLRAGDRVDVDFYPLRNGKPGGMLKTIKLPDGRVLSGW
ncbi:DUF6152 family protein [Aurantiacibacter rhizosphaerae]|uniref:DUF2314 domain-containing protein n=1 Tax=Aurantiacibacter rhizosphaerae TaxID=2691582 RepID=A0A844XB78_9SPHN|nr:DUF6152 family protein [Aurantiacibacter rhizosphaerae]MWV26878.1 hypothetical protein [Aurantiacibacter rhizosphaerae]